MDIPEVVARARNGDHVAFTDLYNHLYAPLFRFVFLRTKDRALAEDITQDTFVKFLAVLPTFDLGTPLPYLHTVARNAIIDHYRKRRPELDDDALLELASHEPTAEESAVLGDDVAEVIRALALLSPTEEAAIRLKYLDSLDTNEISLYLDTSEDAVRQLLSRGLKRVRAYFDSI